MKKVLIIEAQIKQYRRPFYEKLHAALEKDRIQLRVAYSDPATEAQQRDTCDLPPEWGAKVNSYWLWPDRLVYQPVLRVAITADVVIVDEGNKFLLNHFLLPLSRAGIRKVAFWGHGMNRHLARVRLSEWYRRRTLNWVSWWFAYTRETVRYLEAQGVPAGKITAVENSIDTAKLQGQVKSFTTHQQDEIRAQLGIPRRAQVGVFCGALDRRKNLPFLIESSRMIKAEVPDFHLIIVGGGPEGDFLESTTRGLSWIHPVGPRFEEQKAELLAISDVFLLPGAVGLAILDAFAARLPMITVRQESHGPEIEYLEPGLNGLMSAPTAAEYAKTVSSVLNQRSYLAQLKAGAHASAQKYSVENMVANFQVGIRSCLGRLAPGPGVLERGLHRI